MAACKNGNAAPRVRRGSGVKNSQGLAACNSEITTNVIDFATRQPIDQYRQRWLRRRIPIGPELAAYLAEMAFGGGRQ